MPLPDWKIRLAAGEKVGRIVEAAADGDERSAAETIDPIEVPADILIDLLSRPVEPPAKPRVHLVGARILGDLTLDSLTLTRDLILDTCTLDGTISMEDAQARSLQFPNCVMRDIYASRIRCRAVNLGGATVNGEAIWRGARVEVQFVLSDATLSNANRISDPESPTLDLSGARIGADLLMTKKFISHGAIDLSGASIGANLEFAGSIVDSDEVALDMASVSVAGNLFCTGNLDGSVSLVGAHIEGALILTSAHLGRGTGVALNAALVEVGKEVRCDWGFTANGSVSFESAKLGGDLLFFGSDLSPLPSSGVDPSDPHNPGEIDPSDPHNPGEIDPSDPHNPGEIDPSDAHNPGEIDPSDAHNPGEIDPSDAHNPGEIDLSDARISGEIDMRPGSAGVSISLHGTQTRRWQDSFSIPQNVASIEGFTYDSIRAIPEVSVRRRIRWLRESTPQYSPEPYEQLAAYYRRSGEDRARRAVLVAKQWDRRAAHRQAPGSFRRLIGWLSTPWSLLLRGLVGYGYRPWLILLPAIGLFLLACWVFTGDHQRNLITPSEQHAGATFNVAVFATDLLLPVASIGERVKFRLADEAVWHAFAFTISGWLLTVVLLAALGGVFKRD